VTVKITKNLLRKADKRAENGNGHVLIAHLDVTVTPTCSMNHYVMTDVTLTL
jgi:hypothetical protein